ncbi:GH25 family lysozyme [Lapidilactobacillus wuchangensis]|uniref:GH25 family lysozyme n=1 Tax=Lapidilactobacillus wuchangensis TaxID=2486001 RepID=UPI0013DE5295|nr:phage tail protein [Lapidilactobacillus wuchangensis]
MYEVTLRNGWNGEEILIHSGHSGRRLLKGQIVKAVGSYDSFSGAVDPTNIGYNLLRPMQTFIKVTRTDKERVLFEGRLLDTQPAMSSEGIVNQDFSCEGLESFLHDSVQPWAEFHNISPKDFLQSLITEHNKQVESYKQIKLGNVTVTNSTDNVYRFSDDTKDTYDNIKEKLLDKLGGEIRIRHELDGLYLDYEPVIGEQSNQVIRLQSNLISITQKLDPTPVITVLKPLGKAEERTTTDTDTTQAVSTPRLTIATANSGSEFLRDENLISQFGILIRSKTWDDVTNATILKTKGLAFMNSQEPVKQQVQIKAVDLSLIDKRIDDFICGNYYHIINPIMAFDQVLRIVSQTIDICDANNSVIGAGDVLMSQESYNLQLKQNAENAARIAENLRLTNSLQASELAKLQATAKTQSEKIDSLDKAVKELQTPVDKGYYEGSIIDVSYYQGSINWTSVKSAGLALGIVRVQDGTTTIDANYKTYLADITNLGLNYAVYAFFRGQSVSDSEQEAVNFYNRTQLAVAGKTQPRFYAIDVETIEMGGSASLMRSGVEAYMNKLNELGIPDSKIVLYIANNLYASLNLNVSRAGSVWLPTYGANDGSIPTDYKPSYPYDLWQYTSKGTIAGISGNVDMSTNPSSRFKEAYLKK